MTANAFSASEEDPVDIEVELDLAPDIAVPPLEAELFAHPEYFSYFQTVSFLRRMHRIWTLERESEEEFLRHHLRVDGYLSLAFPPNDVVGITVIPPSGAPAGGAWRYPDFDEGERIRLVATFMGLYGSASPLPTFYTEELLDDYRNDLSASKAFLDLVGQLFFIRYYQALGKYSLLDRVVAEEDRAIVGRMLCLLGIGNSDLLGGQTLTNGEAACTGLFSLRQRSASGLASYLAERFALELENIVIEQCLAVDKPIPPDQRACLGSSAARLGEDAVLGSLVRDRMGSFRLALRNLGDDAYHSCLPGRKGWRDLRWAVSFYVNDPLEYEIRLCLKREDWEPVRLTGRKWNELGGDAFLGGARLGDGGDVAGCRFAGVTDCRADEET